MRDVSEPSEGAAEEGAIDEVGVVVADKGWGEGEGWGVRRRKGGEGEK